MLNYYKNLRVLLPFQAIKEQDHNKVKMEELMEQQIPLPEQIPHQCKALQKQT